MLIKWGSIVVKGSGKLGGHVFSGGPGGASVHTLAKARNPQTKYQMGIRARFNLLTQSWRDLTEVQRESWYGAESEFSRKNRFGDTVLLSGKNLYNALNAQRLIIGLPIINIAPLPVLLPLNRATSAFINNGSRIIKLFGKYASSTNYMVVATKGLSNGVKGYVGESKILRVGTSSVAGNDIAGRDQTYSAYVDIFGTPAVGLKIFIGTYAINSSGQRSTMSLVQAEFE